MNKNRKMVIVLLFAFILCFSLAGCTLQDRIEEYSSGKEQCYLNTENVTRFSYKGNDYTILADTVSNGELGEWIGYIRQLAAIDENGKILLQENVEPATFQSLADLAEEAPEAAYIIPFLNVYAAPNADDYLIVDVNGGYHKAVISENVKDSDTVFDFKKTETSVYKGYKQDKIEMRGDRAEMSDFPLYLNTVAGGLDRRDQTIGGFSFVVKIYTVPVVEIIG